jgi:glycosyltransferase involved in cell wall biosynthesis
MSKFAFIYRGNTKGGTKRVIEQLLKEFEKDKENKWVLITDKKECLQRYKNIEVKYFKGGTSLFNYLLWDYFKSFSFLLKNQFDGILYPKGSIPMSHLLVRGKKIYIVNDLGYFVKELNAYPKLDTLFMKFQMRYSCKIADRVIAISKSTKRDIMTRFKINKDKIKVVYLGVEDSFRVINDKNRVKDCMSRNKIKKPYLFYSGSISPRKNLLRVLKAFNEIKDKFPHTLVMTGSAVWGDTGIDKFIEDNNLSERVNTVGFVSEEDLVTLYSEAELYIFPSLYEGFGLPILESQACGTPVLTSNLSSMPEVAGAGALLVDPYNINDISDSISKILSDKKLREDIIKKGLQNKDDFSWEKCSEKILEVFEGRENE